MKSDPPKMVVLTVLPLLLTSKVYNSVLVRKHSNIQGNFDIKYWGKFETFTAISFCP